MNNQNAKDSPYILIPELAAGMFAAITIIIALGGIAATVFVPEGLAAFFLAIVASLLCIVAGLTVVLAVAIIAIFTNSSQIRVYSIAFCSLFLGITLLINVSAYGWFFFDPAKRAEYEAEKTAYDDGIGRLLEDQLYDQTGTGSTSSGYFAWRMEYDWGYDYYNIEGTANGVPMYISASGYDGDTWTIQLHPNTPIPDISQDVSGTYIDQWRVSDGRPLYYNAYSDAWFDIGGQNPYFDNPERIRALNELIQDDELDFNLSWGSPQITYYPNESDLGTAAERRRLSRYIELLTELYPPEGTWNPALCTPYG